MNRTKRRDVRARLAGFSLLMAGLLLGASGLNAQTVKTLYVHGVYPNVTAPNHLIECHNTTWGSGTCSSTASGWLPSFNSGYWKNKSNDGKTVFVGYDGRLDPFAGNANAGVNRLLDALNKHCRKTENKRCIIVSHSMGSLVTGKVLHSYAAPYNILYHTTLSSAENGSILPEIILGLAAAPVAVLAFAQSMIGTPGNGAVFRLTRVTARNSYNHNYSFGIPTYHIAAKKEGFSVSAIIMSGKHDTVVSYSSQCGYPRIAGFTRCDGEDPGIWDPYTLPYTGHKSHPWVSNKGIEDKVHMAGSADSLTQWFTFGYSSSLE